MLIKPIIGILLLASINYSPLINAKESQVNWDERIYANKSEHFSDANSQFENIHVNDSNVYNGLVMSANKDYTIKYLNEIDISKNTKDDVLLEFIPVPTKVGTYDYRIIDITFYEILNESNYFTVRYQYDNNDALIDKVTAKGNNQELYGRKYIRDCDEFDFTALSQNLVGQTRNQKPFESIKIYYDKNENAIYSSTVYNYIDGTSAKRQIRDFDDDLNLKLYGGNSTIEPAWQGFKSNKLGLKIDILNVAGGMDAKIGILNVNGNYISSRIEATSLSNGLVNHEYPLPTPKVYSPETNSFIDYNSLIHDVKVFDENNTEYEVKDNKFVPLNEGKYLIKYAIYQNSLTYAYDLSIDVVATASNISLDMSKCPIYEGMSLFKGSKFDIDINAISTLNINNTKCLVRTNLYFNDSLIDTFTNNSIYHFVANEYGNYKMEIIATDYIERKISKTIKFNVSRSYINFTDSNIASVVVDINNANLEFSLNDIVVKDVLQDNVIDSKDFASYSLNLFYKEENGEYIKFDSPKKFDKLGKYLVKYEVSYKLKNNDELFKTSIEREIEVVNNTNPIFEGENVIEGATLDTSKNDLNATWYKAFKDKTITINPINAYAKTYNGILPLTDIKAVLSIPDEESIDITSLVKNKYSLKLNKIGTYYISFIANNGSNQANKVYAIDVKSNHLTASFDGVGNITDGVVNKKYNIIIPKITNLNNDVISDYTLNVYLINETEEIKIEGNSFVPKNKGHHTLKYVISKDDEVLNVDVNINIVDKTAPIIEIKDYEKIGYVGHNYIFPLITITDDCDLNIQYNITIMYNNIATFTTNSYFTPLNEGEYTIIVDATDLSLNTSTKQFTINVKNETPSNVDAKDNSSTTIVVISIIGGVILCGLIASIAIILKKRKEK